MLVDRVGCIGDSVRDEVVLSSDGLAQQDYCEIAEGYCEGYEYDVYALEELPLMDKVENREVRSPHYGDSQDVSHSVHGCTACFGA